MKYNDNQIQFIKTNVISKYVYNYNYYVKVKNNYVFVNNKRRKFKIKKIIILMLKNLIQIENLI